MSLKLVLDWDGTVTVDDTLDMVLTEFGDPEIYRRAEDELFRSLTLHEVIAYEFESVRAPVAEVVGWLLEKARIRPGFHELVASYEPVIVSSGFHELIEPLLAREGLDVPLLANRVEEMGDGWRVRFRDESTCFACGEACKRGLLPDGSVVYVGDGASDRCAALAAERVFARDGLARYLEGRGVAYERFSDLHDVRRALDDGVGDGVGV